MMVNDNYKHLHFSSTGFMRPARKIPGWVARTRCMLIMFGCVMAMSSYAQPENSPVDNLIPPSPEAAMLGKYAAIPVGLYTGTPEIAIPLWEVKEGNIRVPVSLTYHASGNKVDEIASRVGIGWVLNGGGVISRTVVGHPDEYGTYGFLNLTKTFTPEMAAAEGLNDHDQFDQWRRITRNCWDFEPDQFIFNFNGYTGKFGFEWNSDGDNSIVIGSGNKMKLEPIAMPALGTNGYIQGWKATADDGTVYLFEAKELTKYDPVETENDDPNNVFDDCYDRDSTPTSWFLTQIISPSGGWVKFTYADYHLSCRILATEAQKPIMTSSDPGPKRSQFVDILVSGKNLTGIATSSGTVQVDFIEDTNAQRTDVPPVVLNLLNKMYPLREVLIKTSGAQLLRRFKLGHDYETGRLTLKSVQELAVDNSTPVKPPHQFYYYVAETLPAITTRLVTFFTQDHWGFYNTNPSATLIPIGYETTQESADRSPHEARMRAGMLVQIRYPTGGTTVFDYEPHTYGAVGNEDLTAADQMGGGVRVKRITDYNADGRQAVVRTFEYKLPNGRSSGVISQLPSYAFTTWRWLSPVPGAEPVPVPFKLYAAHSFVPMALTRGSYIGYRQVTVYSGPEGSGGKTESHFTSFYSHNDDYLMDPENNRYRSFNKPYPQPTSFEHARGLLTKAVDYKYDNGQYVAVRRFDHEYDFSQADIRAFKAAEYYPGLYTEDITDDYPAELAFAVSYYHYRLGLFQLRRTVETLLENGQTFTKEKTSLYNVSNEGNATDRFNMSMRFKTSEIMKTGDGRMLVTNFYYPFNYPAGVAPYAQMKEKHILSPVIERVMNDLPVVPEEGGGAVVDAQFTRYGVFDGRILPSQVLKFAHHTPVYDLRHSALMPSGEPDTRYYVPDMRFDAYTHTGNPQQVTKGVDATNADEDEISSYIWDKAGADPIATIINAPFASCAFTDFEGGIHEGNWYFTDGGNFSTDARTGRYAFSGTLDTWNLLPAGQYVVSFWAKRAGTGPSSVSVQSASYDITAEWKHYESIVSLGGYNSITVDTHGNLIDGLRLHPKEGRMNTFTYSPQVGVTSKTDENHVTVFYQYDGLGRLTTVRDEDGNIVKHYQYQYKN